MTQCIEWQGAKSKAGYGQVRMEGKVIYMHRLSYEVEYGHVPEGLTIDHLCRNRSCYNPLHLEAVSMGENVRRGNVNRDYAPMKKDVCPKGHVKDGLKRNATLRGGFQMTCKTCDRDRSRLKRTGR